MNAKGENVKIIADDEPRCLSIKGLPNVHYLEDLAIETRIVTPENEFRYF